MRLVSVLRRAALRLCSSLTSARSLLVQPASQRRPTAAVQYTQCCESPRTPAGLPSVPVDLALVAVQVSSSPALATPPSAKRTRTALTLSDATNLSRDDALHLAHAELVDAFVLVQRALADERKTKAAAPVAIGSAGNPQKEWTHDEIKAKAAQIAKVARSGIKVRSPSAVARRWTSRADLVAMLSLPAGLWTAQSLMKWCVDPSSPANVRLRC